MNLYIDIYSCNNLRGYNKTSWLKCDYAYSIVFLGPTKKMQFYVNWN